jgi:hypothetical protein
VLAQIRARRSPELIDHDSPIPAGTPKASPQSKHLLYIYSQ